MRLTSDLCPNDTWPLLPSSPKMLSVHSSKQVCVPIISLIVIIEYKWWIISHRTHCVVRIVCVLLYINSKSEWDKLAYVSKLVASAVTAVFICVPGQRLTRHTNTHPPLSGLCRGLQRPERVSLTSPHIWMFLLPLSVPCTRPDYYCVITVMLLVKWDSSEVHSVNSPLHYC